MPNLTAAMVAKCPLPVRKLGSRPGSLGSFVGTTLERPIITWELPKDAGMNADSLWKTYGEALIAALRFTEQPTADNQRPAPSN
jgi:protein MpaA